jgi:hypothetical protein
MRETRQESWGGIHNAGIALLIGLLAVVAPRASAAPFTGHFDNLIADLQSRAAALSNSTGTVEKKQFTTVESVLQTLEGKTSTSLATDISNLGNVAKTLAKTFPADFPSGTFGTDLETALQGLVGDVQTHLDATQTTIDGLGASSCATKAQTTLDVASNQVVAASAATDFPTASKVLGTALKTAMKAETAAAKCSSTTSGGGGSGGGGTTSGDFMKATISGDFSLNFDSIKSFVTATYSGSGAGTEFSVIGAVANFHGTAIDVTVLGSIPGPGTYPIFGGSNIDRGNPKSDYGSANGTVTLTTFDPTNQKASGTFSFTATATTGSATITVANGSFSVSKITIVK